MLLIRFKMILKDKLDFHGVTLAELKDADHDVYGMEDDDDEEKEPPKKKFYTVKEDKKVYSKSNNRRGGEGFLISSTKKLSHSFISKNIIIL